MDSKNTKFMLYGLALLIVFSVFLPSVFAETNGTGGNSVYNDSTFTYHVFTGNGTFNISGTIRNASILVVGGGGGGGCGCGGGGGAGGVLITTEYNITTNKIVVVGAGGEMLNASNKICTSFADGRHGGNSSFGTIEAYGGGAGMGSSAVYSFNLNGGCGGGSACSSTLVLKPGNGTLPQGYNGSSNTYTGGKFPAGGGGGASENAPAPPSDQIGARGGNGISSSLNGSAVTYAGGGGGATYSSAVAGAGGTGGGGNGSSTGACINGTNGLGGGGGGSGNGDGNARYGCGGGSGVVIVRYQTNQTQFNPTSFINFNAQQPVNLTTFNFINKKVNITYDYAYLNGSPITLYYKSNNSLTDVVYYVNGTSYTGFLTKTCINYSDAATRCSLDDNDILPGTYNIDQHRMENITHQVLGTLSSPNSWFKVGLHNLTAYPYGFLEFMVNGSTSDTYPVWFCNSTYSTGNPLSDGNCVQIAAIVSNSSFNHTHGAKSKHHVVPFAVNQTTKSINGVGVSNTGYILFRGGASSPQIWGVPEHSNPAMQQRSDNSGATWSNNIAVTADVHIHQLRSQTSFIYYAMGYSVYDNSEVNSAVGVDILEFDYINPTTPYIYPIQEIIVRYSTIQVNWSISVDPQEFTLQYNLTQYHPNGTKSGFDVVTTNTTYTLNFTFPVGNYTFGLYAIDSVGLKSDTSYTNQYKVCEINYTCIHYEDCLTNNIQLCSNVSDVGCGYAYTGNLSTYTQACTYIPTETSLTTIDLSQQGNIILFAVFLFFWVALGVLAYMFKNAIYGGMMFIVGILLGFWSFSISWILTAMFMLFSVLFFMRMAKFK